MKTVPASCAVCARAKSKCVRIPGQDACDRCARLQKECHTREHTRKKRTPSKVTNATQLRYLEKKIESLTQVLTAKSPQDEHVTVTGPFQLTPVDSPCDQEPTASLETLQQHVSPKITLGSPQTSPQSLSTDKPNSFSSLSPPEIQTLLDRYAALMATHMPFVLLPSPLTASSLMHSPSLLRAIAAVAHFHDTSAQQTLVSGLIQHITSCIFSKAEKSLDLLQALLILCTWYNPHLFTSTSHTTLLHLCMALTTDLALDRDPATCELAHMAAAMQSHGIPQPVRVVSDEERRAVLGVFWVGSTSFTSFRKGDVPGWTGWLSSCLERLRANGEMTLVHLVESQRAMHQAMQSPTAVHDAVAPPPRLDTTTSIARDETTCKLLLLHGACANIALAESSLLAPSPDLSALWSCLAAVQSFLDTYLSLPVPSYLCIPFTVFAQFAYVFVVMVRLTSLRIEGFDGALLRETIDFEKVMEEASRRYGEVGRVVIDGKTVRNEGFESWARKTRWAGCYYGMKAKEAEGRGREDGGCTGASVAFDEGLLDVGLWDAGRNEHDIGFDLAVDSGLL